MQNDSLRTLFLCHGVVRMSHKNTKRFSPGGNPVVSARERNSQQTKCAAKDLKLRESISLKDNLSKCNKGNGVLGNYFPLIFLIICRIQEIDELVSPQIFQLHEYY